MEFHQNCFALQKCKSVFRESRLVHTALIFLLLCIGVTTNAQNFSAYHTRSDSVRDAASEFLRRGMPNAIQVITEIDSLPASPYHLNEIEQILLIKGEFDRLIRFSSDYGKLLHTLHARESAHAYFDPDLLSQELEKYLRRNAHKIEHEVEASQRSQMEKDFLKLLVLYHIWGYDFCDERAEADLQSAAANFVEVYDDEQYVDAVNRYFNIRYTPNDWQFGASLTSGVVLPQGELMNFIPNGVPVIGGVSLSYRKIHLFGSFGPGIAGPLLQEIDYQKPWREGDNIMYTMGELQLGYTILNTNRMLIVPVLGIQGVGLNPGSEYDDQYYDDVENLIAPNLLSFGVKLDFKFYNNSNCSSKSLYMPGALYNREYYAVRLSFGYSDPQFDRAVPGMDGSMIFVRIGLSGGASVRQRHSLYTKEYEDEIRLRDLFFWRR